MRTDCVRAPALFLALRRQDEAVGFFPIITLPPQKMSPGDDEWVHIHQKPPPPQTRSKPAAREGDQIRIQRAKGAIPGAARHEGKSQMANGTVRQGDKQRATIANSRVMRWLGFGLCCVAQHTTKGGRAGKLSVDGNLEIKHFPK